MKSKRKPAPRRKKPVKRAAPRPLPETLDLKPAEAPVPGNIPWGYGENRITAMPRDPHWIYAYWELTDEAIARARDEVHDGHGAVVLRVYDTTFRAFDGTNANWYMDVPVHRPANNHYVFVNRPDSVFHVDIGVKSHDGYFAKIARSGPVEMPRASISGDSRVEWMTVSSEGLPAQPYEHRFTPRPPTSAAPPPIEAERIIESLAGEGWSRTEWTETEMGGRTVRWIRWSGPSWRFQSRGSFARIEILFQGEQRLNVHGPWRVVIYGISPDGERFVLDRWTIQYSWQTAGGSVRVETASIVQRMLAGHRTILVQTGSEARLMQESWSSEALFKGASEWHWIGGSESRLGGASELFFAGASEAMGFLGASEIIAHGASELPLSLYSEVRS